VNKKAVAHDSFISGLVFGVHAEFNGAASVHINFIYSAVLQILLIVDS
jgi:hypothetical protein